MVITISETAAKRVNRPSSNITAKTSSPQVARNQLRSAGRWEKGNGKPFCQEAQGISANQLLPRSLVMPASQNSQHRMMRNASGQRPSPTARSLAVRAS